MENPKWFKCKYCGMSVFKKYVDGAEILMENFWELKEAKPHTCLFEKELKSKKRGSIK